MIIDEITSVPSAINNTVIINFLLNDHHFIKRMDYSQGFVEGTFKDVFKSSSWVFPYFIRPRVVAVLDFDVQLNVYSTIWTNLRSSLETHEWLVSNAPEALEQYLAFY